ncbi:MAG: metal dependent phosphohydrolase [Candidatus Saganbacteria bacterium]|uniref:bis(5'-nucleosyl)-tetraphosphatase (symmetrical) n=1 Tax=Candidatus Saganbacteria bacterium TaxID=2575572 RepID=A0A833NSF6_UNCSA|nr:MAG: metal dependent phosphohydrolase [Candidatus Saganbacteria bacterium]
MLNGELEKLLPKERFKHSLRVAHEAVKLARYYGAPEEKAKIAAIFHDCSRYMDRGQMLEAAKFYKLKISELEKKEPKLLHAKLSREIAKRKFKINDRQVLSAIEKHTTGSEKMTLLEKIIYLADHIEINRRFNGVKKVRMLAYKDLNAAIAASAGSMIVELVKKDLPIFLETVKTRNAHL